MPIPQKLPPMSVESFHAQQQGPRMDPMADARHRTAGNVLDSQPEAKGTYRDFLDDGWGYRVYGDGKIKVISAPEGHRSGATLDGGPAYDAIMARVNSQVNAGRSNPPTDFDKNVGAEMADKTGGPVRPPRIGGWPTEAKIIGESDQGEAAPDETSSIDALLASIPELGKTSEQEQPVTLPPGEGPFPSERDVMKLNDMKPGEESEIDYDSLQRGL